MALDSLLSSHFTLGEMIRSSHRTIDNTPTADIVYKLTQLCVWLLEPIRSQFGPMWVDSGYRCPALNLAIGGAGLDDTQAPNASAHMFGCAADLVPLAQGVTIDAIIAWLATTTLPYDQAIDEATTTAHWLHVGIVRPGFVVGPRRELLVMRNGVYTPWHEVENAS